MGLVARTKSGLRTSPVACPLDSVVDRLAGHPECCRDVCLTRAGLDGIGYLGISLRYRSGHYLASHPLGFGDAVLRPLDAGTFGVCQRARDAPRCCHATSVAFTLDSRKDRIYIGRPSSSEPRRGQTMLRRLRPSTILASLALFVSLGGTSMAATGYRITSLFQIAPKVRHELRGKPGSAGPQGPAGTPATNSIVGTSSWFASPGASVAQSDPTTEGILTSDQPATSAVANCPSGSYALEGGYTGNNETVTTDTPNVLAGPTAPPGWTIDARLAPGETSGWVIAWALCVPNLPPS